jgi:DNA-binding IclR family transcriptional regulator
MLKEMVGLTGINQATCGRLLQCLTELGYASKFGPRHGYVLGPMAKALGQSRVYGERWGELSQAAIAHLADQLAEHTLLATFHRGKRYVIARHNGNPFVNVAPGVVFENDMYTTATGRLLLAHASERDLKNYVKKNGLPGKSWDNIKSMTNLQNHLHAIRDLTDAPLLMSNKVLTLIAYPLFNEQQVVAAMGIACLTSTYDTIKQRQTEKLGVQTQKQIQKIIEDVPAI